MVDPCPLCGSSNATFRTRMGYAEIWADLNRTRGVTVAQDVTIANTPAPFASLLECQLCGLEYFDPLAPDDAGFYAALMSVVPHEPWQWEFGLAAQRLHPHEAVVDFGCGEGSFLRAVKDRVLYIMGVDHNARAAGPARAAGIQISTLPFAEFARSYAGQFDVVCGFQIIEHVRCVAELLEPMLSCLHRPGRIILSMPNRRWWRTGEREPLDVPPHHVSRWDVEQVGYLAQQWGLDLHRVDFEEPDYSHAYLAAHDRWVTRVGRVLPESVANSAAGRLTRWTMRPLRHRCLAARGGFAKRGVFGHTMLVELRAS